MLQGIFVNVDRKTFLQGFSFYSKLTLTHVKYLRCFFLFSKFSERKFFVIDRKLKIKAMKVTSAAPYFAYWNCDYIRCKGIGFFTEILKT